MFKDLWVVCVFFLGSVLSPRVWAFDYVTSGDSLSTGAVTHPDLNFDRERLWNLCTGKASLEVVDPGTGSLFLKDDKPTRLGPSPREFQFGAQYGFKKLKLSLEKTFFDTEELSWSYQFGRLLGFKGAQIALSGENGAKVQESTVQSLRMLEENHGTMPRIYVPFFTGNDLCSPLMEWITLPEDYARHMRESFLLLEKRGKPHEKGTYIVVPSYLSIVQLLYEPSILSKKVPLSDKETFETCGDLRKKTKAPLTGTVPDEPWALYFYANMPPMPYMMCPQLFEDQVVEGTLGKVTPELQKAREKKLQFLSNRIRDYRNVQKEVVDAFNERKGKFRYVFVEDTGLLQFQGEDIANDCFHIGYQGHKKVADALLKGFMRQVPDWRY